MYILTPEERRFLLETLKISKEEITQNVDWSDAMSYIDDAIELLTSELEETDLEELNEEN